MPRITRRMGNDPESLRRYLQEGSDPALKLRRGVVAASLAGIGAMGATALLQMGLVKDLPDPPMGNFHSKRVNSSKEAYSYGGPDSPIVIAAHGLNMVLASTGGPDRARRYPWIPVVAALFSGAQAVVAAKYLFYQMPRVDKAWCPYCIVDALAHFAAFICTLPEAVAAAGRLRERGKTKGTPFQA